ncbi:unnamed protein product [Arabidopsis thaliana]|uniref:Uncharacterized protein n=1 Tax=Arabidopsis thaliana TaxID=3702 RepID=Q9LUZ2_ARATH|nr:unnamed protein product [Arabidopsis thaliana]
MGHRSPQRSPSTNSFGIQNSQTHLIQTKSFRHREKHERIEGRKQEDEIRT